MFLKTFRLIKKHKVIVLFMFLIQIGFFLGMGLNTISMMTPALSATQEVLSYIQQLKLDQVGFEETLTGGPSVFGEDPMMIYKNYDIIMNFLKLFIAVSLIIFIIFEGSNWILTNQMIKKARFKQSLKRMRNFAILSLGYFLVIGFIVYQQLKVIVDSPLLPKAQMALTTLIIFILTYFMFISFSLLDKPLKKIMRESFQLGIYKAYMLLPVMISIVLFIFLLGFFMFRSIEINFVLTILLIALFAFSFILARILFVNFVKELD